MVKDGVCSGGVESVRAQASYVVVIVKGVCSKHHVW